MTSINDNLSVNNRPFMMDLKSILKVQIDFLLFKKVKPNLEEMGNRYFLVILFFTWLAGIGRYWDNPRAEWWQLIGLGSVSYLFIMSWFLWIVIKPLKPDNWSYFNVLIFVGLTSLPAILYAIPVERFMTMQMAQRMNVLFLGTVALWRVALLISFLKRSAKLSGFSIAIGTLFPIDVIIVCLTMLNLEHVVFRIMGGLKPEEVSGNDGAYFVLMLITFISIYLSPILITAYIIKVYRARYN